MQPWDRSTGVYHCSEEVFCRHFIGCRRGIGDEFSSVPVLAIAGFRYVLLDAEALDAQSDQCPVHVVTHRTSRRCGFTTGTIIEDVVWPDGPLAKKMATEHMLCGHSIGNS
jgi:hypothetical protein